jgi:hypothetical protein
MMQSILTSLANLLSGQAAIVIKPLDPERPLQDGGAIIRVESVRGRG